MAHPPGTIQSLPTVGKRTVNLGAMQHRIRTSGNPDWFERDELSVLGPSAHMRNNARLIQQGKWEKIKDDVTEPLEAACAACHQRLADIYQYVDRNYAPNYKVVKVETEAGDDTTYFCWSCAGCRQTMLDALSKPHWRDYVADDGDDVFGFIEQTIFEDGLADQTGIAFLQCHAGDQRKIARKYQKVIGGRLLTLRDRGQYSGPIRPHEPNATVDAHGISLSADESPSDIFAEPALDADPDTAIFDPAQIEDARRQVIGLITQRRGQEAFRQHLLHAYDGKCAISGCDAEAALEAAHIVPYRGPLSNHPTNGLLLRADLHTLFDLGLITFDAATMRVDLDPSLRSTTYHEFDDVEIRLPENPADRPSRAALTHRASLELLPRSCVNQ